MASISTETNGRRRVQFTGLDGKRRTLRLGKANKRDTEQVALHIDSITSRAAQA